MALDTDVVQLTRFPDRDAITVYNASTVTAIDADMAVIVDTANVINDTTNITLAVTYPGTSTPGIVIGFTRMSIPALGYGLMSPLGKIINATAYGTVTAGTIVDACTVTSYTGRVQTHTAAQYQVGVALLTANDGEKLYVMATGAENA